MQKTLHGSCFCKRITFEADLDIAALGTTKCNCTSCWKRRWWSVSVKPEAFRPLTGDAELASWRHGEPPDAGGGFCRYCGVIPYARIAAAEWNDGPKVSINVAALDDLDPKDLLEAPITYCDGRNDNWWNPPEETRHL